jgi:uncharacterized protein (DUF924 family)
MPGPVEVLEFWLNEIGEEGWFNGGDALDAACRDRFHDLWQAARDGGLEHWAEGATGTLAYLILTDQFPRNMFRGSPDAFATDPLARNAARRAVAMNWDLEVPEVQRAFFYLPFEHSELIADQDWSVALFAARTAGTPELGLHAEVHRRIIARFGRFPFRNAALGRETTPEEQAFLDAGAYPALVNQLRAELANSHAPDA